MRVCCVWRKMRVCCLWRKLHRATVNPWNSDFPFKIDIISDIDIKLPYGHVENDLVFQIPTILLAGSMDLVSFC